MTENGAQLFARLEGRRSLKDIEPLIFPEDGGPNHGDVVELHGTEGTGKTELLYHLLARCLLPGEAGGLGVEVVFIDTDHHFDMLRLVTVLEHHLAPEPEAGTGEGAGTGCPEGGQGSSRGQSQDPVTSDPEARVRACLGRLSVVHCSSSAQLLLTLHFLETSFCSRPALCLLIIDSIAAFYWMDRSGGGDSIAKQEVTLRKCSELLARLLRDYRITVFATTHAIMRNYGNCSSDGPGSSSEAASSSTSWRRWTSSQASDYDRPYLCRAWQRLVTHRLLLARAETGVGTKEHRHVFTATCTSSSSTNRSKGVKNFSFFITEGGLKFA